MNNMFRTVRCHSFSSFRAFEELGLTNVKSIQLTRPQRQMQVGQSAPMAYHDTYQYPEGYKPWTINYKGNGVFWLSFIICWYSYYQYEQTYLKRTEQIERPERSYHNV